MILWIPVFTGMTKRTITPVNSPITPKGGFFLTGIF